MLKIRFLMPITLGLCLVISMVSTLVLIPINPLAGQMQPFLSTGASSISMVNGVTVTAINATDDNTITTSLNYAGSGTAPSITLVATAIDVHARSLNSLMSNLTKGGMIQLPSILTGSNIITAGWKSPNTVSVKLEGNSTTPLHNANLISVQVFPFTG